VPYKDPEARRAMLKRRYQKYKARWREYERERGARDPLFYRRWNIKKAYGLSLEQWDELHASQDFRCAICSSEVSGGKGWHTDHCHTTKIVRGILCMRCNSMLGYAKDKPKVLRAGAKYLERAR
jgi:hypothetical protein